MKLKLFLYNFLKVIFLLFLLPTFVFADIILSEIMYDPDGTDTGYEWIEIKNTYEYSKNLEGWKFCEGADSTVCHSIREEDNLDFNINTNSFGIITDDRNKFLEKNSFDGLVLESTGFSLLNSSGEKLELKNDEGDVVDFVTYNPVSGGVSGDSLSLFIDVWKNGEATPGFDNIEKNGSESGSEEDDFNDSDSFVDEVVPKTYVEITDMVGGKKRIKAEINEIPVVVAGAKIRISGRAYGLTDNEIHSADYFWSMGDGGKNKGKEIFYKYDFPGEYIVSLTTKVGHFTGTDRKKIKVIGPEIIISSVDFENNLVEIENQSNDILNIENWIISVNGDHFIIPENTFIDRKSKIIFTNRIMGFRSFEKDFKILLLFPDKERVFVFKEEMKKVIKTDVVKSVEIKKESGNFLKVELKQISPSFKVNIKSVEASILEEVVYKDEKIEVKENIKNTASMFNAFSNNNGEVLDLSFNDDFFNNNLIHLIFISFLFFIVLVVIFFRILNKEHVEKIDFIDVKNEAKKYNISEIE